MGATIAVEKKSEAARCGKDKRMMVLHMQKPGRFTIVYVHRSQAKDGNAVKPEIPPFLWVVPEPVAQQPSQ
jgi:hypothetical protein